MGRRHHYVPKFYLRAFSADGRRINLFNLNSGRFVFGASLRDQCYASRFYGHDDRVENVLAEIEGVAARVFAQMRDHGSIPGGGTADRAALLLFIGLQLARTTGTQEYALRMSQLLTHVAFDGKAPERALKPKEITRIMLSLAPNLAATIGDLSMTVLTSPPGASFATSDNPVFKYNSYCEGILHFGVTGTQCKGLQLFFPISPTKLLFLFDAAVYKLVRIGRKVVALSLSDVEQLNRLQLIGASENAYFREEMTGHQVEQNSKDALLIRNATKPTVVRAVDDSDENSELLHQFWPMPQLNLRLSVVSIRPSAEALPRMMRMRRVRSPYESAKRPPEPGETHRRFTVRSRYDAPE